MDHLPWLVVSGSIVWKSVVVLAALVGLWLARPKDRLRASREIRRSRRRLGQPLSSLQTASDGAQVLLRGRLKSLGGDDGRSDVPRFEDGQPAVVTTAFPLPRTGATSMPMAFTRSARDLRLIMDDGEVLLIDAVNALVGSRELQPGRVLQRLGPDIVKRLEVCHPDALKMLGSRQLAFTSLTDGDEVVIQGTLRREAGGDQGQAYRSSTDQWSLVGEPQPLMPGGLNVPRLTAASVRPTEVRGPWWPHATKLLGGGFVGGAAALALLWFAGSILSSSVSDYSWNIDPPAEAEGCPTLHVGALAQLTAATPFHRGRTLRRLASAEHLMWSEVIERERCSDEALETLASMIILADQEGSFLMPGRDDHVLAGILRGIDCSDALSLMVRHGRPDRAVELAQSCSAPRAQAWLLAAHLARGRLDLASDLLDELDDKDDLDVSSEVRIHLLAGQPGRAAQAAREQAERRERAATSLPEGTPESLPYSSSFTMAGKLRCIALNLEARSGDEDAREKLIRATGWSGDDESGDTGAWTAPPYARRYCIFLSQDVLPPSKRLNASTYGSIPFDIARMQDLQSWEEQGVAYTGHRWSDRLDSPSIPGVLEPGSPFVIQSYDGLEASILSDLLSDHPNEGQRIDHQARGLLFTRAALFELYLGDSDRAIELARRASDELEASDIELRPFIPMTPAPRCGQPEIIQLLALLEAGGDEFETAAAAVTAACGRRGEALESLSRDLRQRASTDGVELGDDLRLTTGVILRHCQSRQGELVQTQRHLGEVRALHRFSQDAEIDQLDPLYTRDGDADWSLRQRWMSAKEGDGRALAKLMGSPAARRFLPRLAPRISQAPSAVLDVIGASETDPFAHLNGFASRDEHPLQPELTLAVERLAVYEALGYERRAEMVREAVSRLREALLRRQIAVPLAVLEME